MDELNNKRLILEEMRRAYDRICLSGSRVQDKLKVNLVIVAPYYPLVISVIMIAGVSLSDKDCAILSVGLVAYLAFLTSVILGLSTAKYPLPVSQDWDEIYNRYFRVTESEAIDLLIAEHIRAMSDVENVKKRISAHLLVSYTLLLPVILIPLIVLMNIASRATA